MADEPKMSEELVINYYKTWGLDELEFEIEKLKNYIAEANLRISVAQKMVDAQKNLINGLNEQYPGPDANQDLAGMMEQPVQEETGPVTHI